MRCHQSTKDYVKRRPTQGKPKTEFMRCVKRNIARAPHHRRLISVAFVWIS
ncbi:hypothetical protein EV384_2216 [Micromonospora kangleipakensis]|uniref:Uncharacterized protein n=1 Tax=Micromonospora kangleipakensis TaxID=1077942 RepID=A0A4Q8B803_9ACTN|nr:hypothetical protein EV384_2216 [Micromonospora kangleipakensis]